MIEVILWLVMTALTGVAIFWLSVVSGYQAMTGDWRSPWYIWRHR